MDKIIEILEDIVPGEKFEGRTDLVDGKVLDSFAIMNTVSELEDEFDIEIGAGDVIPDNFNSVEAMWALVQRLQG